MSQKFRLLTLFLAGIFISSCSSMYLPSIPEVGGNFPTAPKPHKAGGVKHSHSGRVHIHALPAAGVNHSHRQGGSASNDQDRGGYTNNSAGYDQYTDTYDGSNGSGGSYGSSSSNSGAYYDSGTSRSENIKDKEDYSVVRVLYGTNRKRTNSKDINERFGSKRGDIISYGEALVSIPSTHKLGKIESPSIWRFEFSRSSKKHVKLLKLTDLNRKKFFLNLNIDLKHSAKKSALIFIHGFNVKFSNATRRTAQIVYDLEFSGVPILYSWPSVGRVSAYTIDESNIKASEYFIEMFLEDFIRKTGVKNIYLIAHSMGNRGLTRSLARLLERNPNMSKVIKEIILAAPDIDAEVFKRSILPRITKYNNPVTLYASADDRALLASKRIHGYPRAGDVGKSLVIDEKLETIDATGLDTSLLRHSYFSESSPVLADINSLINNKLRARDRYRLKISPDGSHWVFAH